MAEEFIQTHIFAKNKKGNAKLLFKDNEVLAHHLIQSFSPDDTLSHLRKFMRLAVKLSWS